MSHVQLRPMVYEQDKDAVRRILYDAFRLISNGTVDMRRWAVDYVERCLYAQRTMVAEIDGQVVGSLFTVLWGSCGFFGPLSVAPECQGTGVAQRLVKDAFEFYQQNNIQHVEILTFASSLLHHHLYRKFGLFPTTLIYLMQQTADKSAIPPETLDAARAQWTPDTSDVAVAAASVVGSSTSALRFQRYSQLGPHEQRQARDGSRRILQELYPGMDMSVEFESLRKVPSLGDALLAVDADGTLQALAVLHQGPGTEAGHETTYIKAAIATTVTVMDTLLQQVAAVAVATGLPRLTAGVTLSRRATYDALVRAGFKPYYVASSMQMPVTSGADVQSYNRAEALLIWRP